MNTKNSFSGSSLDPLTTLRLLLLIWIPGCSLVPSLRFWPVQLLFVSPGASSQMENRFAPKGIAGSQHWIRPHKATLRIVDEKGGLNSFPDPPETIQLENRFQVSDTHSLVLSCSEILPWPAGTAALRREVTRPRWRSYKDLPITPSLLSQQWVLGSHCGLHHGSSHLSAKLSNHLQSWCSRTGLKFLPPSIGVECSSPSVSDNLDFFFILCWFSLVDNCWGIHITCAQVGRLTPEVGNDSQVALTFSPLRLSARNSSV